MADAPDTERQAVNPDSRAVLSVSQLNDRIASVVEETPALHGVRCIGEVTDLHQNSTALYFTLTDGNAELPVCSGRTATATWTSTSRTGPRSSSKATSTTGSKAGKSTSNRGSHRRRRRRPGGGRRATAKRTRGAWLVRRRAETAAAGVPGAGRCRHFLRGDARYDIQNAIHEQDPTVDILIKDATVQGSTRRHPSRTASTTSTGRRTSTRLSSEGRGAIRTSKRSTPSESRRRFTANTPVVIRL